jgi:hypothetical protein
LKVSILTVAFTNLLFLFAANAHAGCNTVMGGCTTEEIVNVAPHMRSDAAVNQKKLAVKPADKTTKQPSNIITASKNSAKKL